ncbi:ASHH2 [Symbiodinium necroappetens]|uniref:ASHH2 protein n=1 Tax=Symbiodinium necroappetens TaxID=1628268 RepID=A0A812N3I0_9DINO|nr:ASHH2 [Symbiodinium necroappetens]
MSDSESGQHEPFEPPVQWKFFLRRSVIPEKLLGCLGSAISGSDQQCLCGKQCFCNLVRSLISLDATCSSAPLSILRSGGKGYGLFAQRAIAAGSFVTEFTGELVKLVAEGDLGRYSIPLRCAPHFVLDAGACGGKARFVNHSCKPNSVMVEWLSSAKLDCAPVIALTDIPSGQEITIDYKEPSTFGWDEEQPCLCGSSPECHPPHALLSYGMVRSWAEEAMFYAVVLPPQDGDAILEQQIWDVDFGVHPGPGAQKHLRRRDMEGSWL